MHQIQIDTTAKVPDASLNLIQSMEDFFPEKKTIDDNLRTQLIELGLYENVMRELRTQENSNIIQPQNFVRLSGPLIAAVGYPDPADIFHDLNLSHEVLNPKNEQEKLSVGPLFLPGFSGRSRLGHLLYFSSFFKFYSQHLIFCRNFETF